MDEVFSPQQLMIDVEIADFVEHVEPGPLPPGRDDPVELIRRGVEAGGFLDDDITLDVYERFLWRPRLFDLGPRAAWTGRTVLDKAARLVEDKLAGYDYDLSDDRRSALDGIMARARKALG